MKHMPLHTLLQQYSAESMEQQGIKQKMLQLLKTHNNCFQRECLPAHFTASAWLLNKTGDQVLLLHHRKLNIWLQPGGHCDGNSNALAVAIKEAQEESGIQQIRPIFEDIFDLDIHLIPARKNEPEHYHYDIRFLLQVTSDESATANSESHAVKWFNNTLEALPTQEPSIIRLLQKQQHLSFP